MAALLRKAGVSIGLVTDGRWWAIVWAEEGKTTGSGIVDAITWGEEPLLRDAFLTLIDQQRLRAKNPDHRLPRLLERSELEAEEITEALGTQVRRSVELLVQAFSETRLAAAENGEPDPLAETPDEVYQAAVTVMMRVVFLLFAEERGMLPTEQLYWDSYAIRGLLDDLKQQAADGEEHLDESHDAWHRLLAVSDALYCGCQLRRDAHARLRGLAVRSSTLPVADRDRSVRPEGAGIRPGDAARAGISAGSHSSGRSQTDLVPRHRRRADRLHLRRPARLLLCHGDRRCRGWSGRQGR